MSGGGGRRLARSVIVALSVILAPAGAAVGSPYPAAAAVGSAGSATLAGTPGSAASGGGAPGGAVGSTAGILGAVQPATTAAATNSATPNSATTGSATSTPCTGPSPKGIYSSTLTFTVRDITPQVVTSTGPASLTVTGTMTNAGSTPLTEIGYKFQRGDALVGEAAIRNEAANPCQPVTIVNSGFVGIDGTLAPGASVPFSATVPVPGTATSTLAVTDPGVYPVMINFNATVQSGSGDVRARVGEVHLLLTVLSVPKAPVPPGVGVPDGTAPDATATAPADSTSSTSTASTSTASGSNAGTTPTPIPYSMVWTFVDRPHLGVGGIFLDDDLVPEISPGGGLYQKLQSMTAVNQVANSATLAIDPELLDELDLMSRGYWVVAPAGATQASITPVPRGTPTASATSTAPPTDTNTNTAEVTDDHATTDALTSAAATDPAATDGATNPPDSSDVAASGTDAAQGAGVTGSLSAGASPSSTAPDTATTDPSSEQSAATSDQTTGAAPSTTDTAPATTTYQPAGTVAGTGREAAAAFLARLRELATTTPVLVLPYSDPDAVALVRAGMTESLASAVYLGRAVASRVLGIASAAGTSSTLITDLAYPVGGLADTATLSALGADGLSGAILSPSGVSGLARGSSVSTVALSPSDSGPTSLTALVPNSTLLNDIAPYLTTGVPAGSSSTLNLIAAVLAGEYLAGTGQPLLVVPDRAWTPDQAGLGAITSLLAVFSSQGAVVGTDLRALAQNPSGSLTAQYPAAAKAQELSASLLHRVDRADHTITSMGTTLSGAKGPDGADPDDVLDPLRESLTRLTSASLRSNPDPANRVLATVDSSLRAIEDGVTVPAPGGSLTLASSSAPLRLTVTNSLPYDVRIRVRIGGGQRVGLTVTDPGFVEVPAGRSVPIKVSAHVARSGTFSITIQLVAADGREWSRPSTLQVNSRAYGTLTLVLLLVAGSVLVLMIVIRIVQRTRARRNGSGAPPDTADPTDPVVPIDPAPDGAPAGTAARTP